MDLRVGQVDIDENSILSTKWMVMRLPTVFHVLPNREGELSVARNGKEKVEGLKLSFAELVVVREIDLDSARTAEAFAKFATEGYKSVSPISSWGGPYSFWAKTLGIMAFGVRYLAKIARWFEARPWVALLRLRFPLNSMLTFEFCL